MTQHFVRLPHQIYFRRETTVYKSFIYLGRRKCVKNKGTTFAIALTLMLPYVPPLKSLFIRKLNELWIDLGVVKFFKVKIKATVWSLNLKWHQDLLFHILFCMGLFSKVSELLLYRWKYWKIVEPLLYIIIYPSVWRQWGRNKIHFDLRNTI